MSGDGYIAIGFFVVSVTIVVGVLVKGRVFSGKFPSPITSRNGAPILFWWSVFVFTCVAVFSGYAVVTDFFPGL